MKYLGSPHKGSTVAPHVNKPSVTVVDLEATGEVHYSLKGPDAAYFKIDASGHLTYANGFVPDFENPADVNGDNVYHVTVVRSTTNKNGVKEPTHEDVQITICDKDEGPTVGAVCGRFFCDTDDDNDDNGNGDEPGVNGVEVALVDAAGNIVATTTTGATAEGDGYYDFQDVAPGNYKVVFTYVDDGSKQFVTKDAGVDDTSDSDVEVEVAFGVPGRVTQVAETDFFSLAAGEKKDDLDGGVEEIPTAPTGEIKGRYFCDINDNGVDDGEPGIEGIRVRLRDQDTKKIIADTYTDENGDYCFDGLDAGKYQVRFTGVDGRDFVEFGVGSDTTIDSDVFRVWNNGNARSKNIHLDEGESVLDIDAGVTALLPSNPVTFVITDENVPSGASDEAFSVDFSGTGIDCYDKVTYTAVYCIDIGKNVGDGLTQKGTFEVVNDATFGTTMGIAGDQMDNVLNYIVNTDWEAQGFTDAEVQGAVWGLFDSIFFVAGGAGTSSNAEAILDAAKADGLDFKPDNSGSVAVLVTPEDNGNQPFVIGVDYDCIC